MFVRLLSVAISLCLLLGCGEEKSNLQLTEDIVLELNSSVKNAVERRDIDGLMAHFSDEVVIEMEIATPTGSQQSTMDKPGYKQMTQLGWQAISDYDYEVRDVLVTLNEDSTEATVTGTVLENMTMMGQVLSSRTRERFKVRLFAGEAKITYVHGIVSMN